MITQKEKDQAILDEPLILVTDLTISAIQEIVPVLEKVVESSKPLLIIANEIAGDVLATLLMNKQRGTICTVAVQAPGYGERRKAYLQDIATITGAKVLSIEIGTCLESISKEDFGQARRIIVDKNATIIIDGRGEAEAIRTRCEQVRQEFELTTSAWDKEKLQERLGWLQGGIAVIKAGAATEVELREKRDRLEDALQAVRAAIKEGIVPGGGIALLEAGQSLGQVCTDERDINIGIQIVQKALEAPLRQIALNAGYDGSFIANKVMALPKGHGYNAQDDTFMDMFEAGIIDPLKVTRTALRSAASIAALILTTEGLIVNLPA
jgi:chaperonin GroEL